MPLSSEVNDTVPGHVGHIVPLKVLAGVFGALLLLTIVTVLAASYDLGKMNIWLALLIAVAKAGLVALYFMHLRYDSPFNGIVFVCALLFVAIFISLALVDTTEYQPDFDQPAGIAAGQ